MEPLVSIVIPVYNANLKTLSLCMSSIRNQTYKRIEVILSDDGSDWEHVNGYEVLLNESTRIIHHPNKGASVARNVGTKIANGKYIMYVDADDILFSFSVERAVRIAETQQCDMVIGAVIRTTEIPKQIPKDTGDFEVLVSSDDFLHLAMHYLKQSWPSFVKIQGDGEIRRGPVARLIRSDIAKKVTFPEGIPLGEDVIWNFRLLKCCSQIAVDYNIWYCYLVNEGSAIQRYYGNRSELVTNYLKLLLEENPEIENQYRNAIVKNMAVEFYCILNYDWMSPKCPMKNREKIIAAKQLLDIPVWKSLSDNYLFTPIPVIHKIFIFMAKYGIWPIPLKLYRRLKK